VTSPDTPSAPQSDLITQAEEQLRVICGWHIAPEKEEVLVADNREETLVHDGRVHLAFLPTKKLVEVLEVEADSQSVGLDRVFVESSGILEIKGLSLNTREVKVKVRHGYEIMPPALAAVATAMATRAANPHGSMRVGQISIGGTTAPTPQGAEWRTIDAFKLGPLP